MSGLPISWEDLGDLNCPPPLEFVPTEGVSDYDRCADCHILVGRDELDEDGFCMGCGPQIRRQRALETAADFGWDDAA